MSNIKKYIFLLLTLSLLLTSCSQEPEIIVKKYYETTLVSTGTISDEDNWVGYTQSISTTPLSTKIGGKITNMYKEIGDEVKSGELIAILDGSEGRSGVNTANSIEASLIDLKNATASMYNDQIKAMEQKIAQAETGIEIGDIGISGSEQTLDDTIKNKEEQLKTIEKQIQEAENQISKANIGVETAENSLKNALIILDEKKKQIYTNGENSITNSIITANNVINFADELLEVSNENRNNNNYDNFLGARDISLKTSTEDKLRELISKIEEYENIYAEKISSKDYTEEEMKEILNIGYTLFSKLRNLMKMVYDTINSSTTSSDLTDEVISNLKEKTNSFQSQIEGVILTVSGEYIIGLKGNLDAMQSIEKEYQAQKDSLKKAVELARSNLSSAEGQLETLRQTYNQYEAMNESQISSVSTQKELANKQKELAVKSLEEAKLNLETLKKQKETKLHEINTKIKEVIGNKSEANVMIENTKVIAPFDGNIIQKYGELGQIVGAGTPIYEISGEDGQKIIIGIPTEISENISVGDKTTIEIEGKPQQYTGIVNKILPIQDTTSKKVQIEIYINDLEKDTPIGSYGKVSLNKSGESGIIIPNNAILGKFSIPGVYVIKDSIVIFTRIKIIKQNDNFSLISGLDLGDEIITKGKENIYDGEIVESME